MLPESSALILVVEDDPGVATLQKRRLERAGFRVRVASDVEAAMHALAEERITLVLVDYRLGNTTGLDLHRRMKVSGFDVPVIIVSGSIDDTVVIEAMRAGVRDVVVKSTDYLDYLPDTVRGVINQAAAVPVQRHDQHSARVLVVEDDAGVATLERRQLERAGYTVTVARDADEALEEIRRTSPSLAVLDLRLGGDTSGLDLYDRLRAEGRTIPAILVTAFPDQAVAVRALRAGVRDFVPKSPDFLEYLPQAVDRVLAQARVERKLVESEMRLASIIGTTMDAIVMCDEDLCIVLFNRSAEEMFGCRAADALDSPLGRFFPELRLEPTANGDGGPGSMRQRVEVDGVRIDATRVPIEVSVSDVVVHGRRLFTVIARDVTERRRIEAELRDADRRKDEFLGMLAHELRNPLAAIATAGEVLHRTMRDPAGERLTAVIKRQTGALSRMVDDLLDVSRVTLGKIQLTREPLLLGDVVSRAVDGSREAVRRAGLEIAAEFDPDPVWVKGDATRLEQVLANLLTNAVKFTPRGGRITVTAGRQGDEAIVRVRDTGIGIEAPLLSRVFDLFVQGDTSLDRSKSGLGIGLALVRQVVALHGGHVAAFSAGPGTGSEFVVRLPVSEAPQRPRLQTTRDAASSNGGLRVLIVDDQRDLADCIAMLVEALGHTAQPVYDGKTALEVGRRQAPDVMFVDIGMPGMTGYELARQVRLDPALASTRLVALTGYGREEDRARVLDAGFDLHLTKPVTDTTLEGVLATLRRPGARAT